MKNDTLKYWPVVRFYAKKKYKLTGAELELLLFLRSEGRFGADKFRDFSEIFPWNKQRFQKLVREGWIVNFRRGYHGGNKGPGRKAIYRVSRKTITVIANIYKYLGGSPIPEDNLPFSKDPLYSEKVYRNAIIQMNKDRNASRVNNLKSKR